MLSVGLGRRNDQVWSQWTQGSNDVNAISEMAALGRKYAIVMIPQSCPLVPATNQPETAFGGIREMALPAKSGHCLPESISHLAGTWSQN